MNLREKILQASDIKKQRVHVPEWDVDVFVKSMTLAEREDFENKVEAGAKNSTFLGRFLAEILVDENGQKIFSEDDVEALKNKSYGVVERLCKIGTSLNIMTEEDVQSLEKK